VPHAHIHLIPTTNTLDMSPAKGKMKLSAEQLQQVQRKILDAMKG
jgi:diadenosine tetraphosphate (Ap4A) HIT family hydrolase